MDEKRKMQHENDEVEIDLLQLLLALRHRLWLIILAAIVCGGLAGAYSKFILTPQYTSTAMMYILTKETTLTSLADLQIGSQLTKDYTVIINSRPVLEEVIQKNGLLLTYEQMKKKVQIDNPADTRILYVSVQDPDPYLAKTLADDVAMTSSQYIGDIMEMVPPKLIENSVVAQYQSSPGNRRNALLGAMAGILLTCGLVVLKVIMNDTIRTEEDVARYLDITVLAMVPARAGDSERHGSYGGEEYRRGGSSQARRKNKKVKKARAGKKAEGGELR